MPLGIESGDALPRSTSEVAVRVPTSGARGLKGVARKRSVAPARRQIVPARERTFPAAGLLWDPRALKGARSSHSRCGNRPRPARPQDRERNPATRPVRITPARGHRRWPGTVRCRGGTGASTTRSIPCRSRTRTAMERAIFRACCRGSIISPGLVYLPSGSRRSTARPWKISAMTLPISPMSTSSSERSTISTAYPPLHLSPGGRGRAHALSEIAQPKRQDPACHT
jgi:hypothetical protein